MRAKSWPEQHIVFQDNDPLVSRVGDLAQQLSMREEAADLSGRHAGAMHRPNVEHAPVDPGEHLGFESRRLLPEAEAGQAIGRASQADHEGAVHFYRSLVE